MSVVDFTERDGRFLCPIVMFGFSYLGFRFLDPPFIHFKAFTCSVFVPVCDMSFKLLFDFFRRGMAVSPCGASIGSESYVAYGTRVFVKKLC